MLDHYDSFGGEGGDYWGSWGGGGGGTLPRGSRPLREAESEKLNSIKEDLLSEEKKDCTARHVINSVWNQVTFRMDWSMKYPAKYNCSDQHDNI